MKAIVPIVGFQHSLPGYTGLKNRVDYLLRERGFEPEWVGEENIAAFLKVDRAKVFVPLIINVRDILGEKNPHADLILPICDTFSSANVVSENLFALPNKIFGLPQEISLWEKLSPPQNFVCEAIKYVYAHLSSANLSTTEIAHEIYTSKNTLERKFKDWNGAGVWHFVKHVRLFQAKRILQESDDLVNGVASSVGYEDYRTFSKAFKNEFHISPIEFRQGHCRIDNVLVQNDTKLVRFA